MRLVRRVGAPDAQPAASEADAGIGPDAEVEEQQREPQGVQPLEDMLEVARARGVRVAWRDLGRGNAEYHSTGLVVLNPRRTVTVQRVTLAHELGHQHYGHTWTDDPVLRARQERIADENAAELLIEHADYVVAETVAGPHVGALARELGVTNRIVEAWQRCAGRARMIA